MSLVRRVPPGSDGRALSEFVRPAGQRSQSQTCSGDPYIAALRGESPLFLGQVRLFDGSYETPVPPYWTTLEPPPAKTDRFQGSAWDLNCGVQVAISAPHEGVATDRIAATAHHDGGP